MSPPAKSRLWERDAVEYIEAEARQILSLSYQIRACPKKTQIAWCIPFFFPGGVPAIIVDGGQ